MLFKDQIEVQPVDDVKMTKICIIKNNKTIEKVIECNNIEAYVTVTSIVFPEEDSEDLFMNMFEEKLEKEFRRRRFRRKSSCLEARSTAGLAALQTVRP